MSFAWRAGFLGWKTAARCGLPLIVHADVLWDEEAGVFVVSSDDFLPEWGCVAESPTWDGLEKELRTVISEVLEDVAGSRGKRPAFTPILHFARS